MVGNTSRRYAGTVLFRVGERAFTFDDVTAALRGAGVLRGETAMVHSDLGGFGKLGDLRDRSSFALSFIDALLEVLGPEGNLVVPTFSHSFCRDEVFDPENTPSGLGTLSEIFRKLPEAKRSLDPLFSVAVIGPAQRELASVGRSCFGAGSVFEKLHERNARLILLGDTFDLTFIHYAEEKLGVTYRYIKRFSGEIRVGDELRNVTVDYFVRPLDGSVNYDVERLANILVNGGVLTEAALGASKVRAARAADVFESIRVGLMRDPRLLLVPQRPLDG